MNADATTFVLLTIVKEKSALGLYQFSFLSQLGLFNY